MGPSTEGAVFPASDRIKQLNDIDRDIFKLLHSAGLAVKSLTRPTDTSNDDSSTDPTVSVDQRKESFAAATSSYFAILSSIDVRLRRQIYALEEAEILPADASAKDSQTNATLPPGIAPMGVLNAQPPRPASKGTITGWGLGSLDIGWLNSRHDHVRKEKEAELWEEAQKFVDKLSEERLDTKQGTEVNEDDGKFG